MEDKLTNLLSSIGFSKRDIEVYINLLKNPPSSAYIIANRLGQHRSGIYESLRRLQQKGFIVEIKEQGKKIYQTKEYTAIEEFLKQKQSELKELDGYLKGISNVKMPQENLSISYGLTRLRTMFSNILNLNCEVLIWTVPKNINELVGEWFLKEIYEKIASYKLPTKIMYSKYFNSLEKVVLNNYIEERYLDEESNIFTITCSDFVFLIVLGSNIAVIEMKNKEIAQGFKSRFLTLWEKSEKIKK